MRKAFMYGAAVAGFGLPTFAAAQSTGSIDAETDIIVSGTRAKPNINGIEIPETPKPKAVLTQEFIAHRVPGQSILDTINQIPGVNFTNSDPYGASGGQLRIRGFDGARVALTFDGIPLNDSGNYSIYSNQQLDPELIEQVNVNFGSTDVDSPTASASGGTVNYRSLTPTDTIGATVVYSHGTYDMNRVFGLFNTGTFTKFGTKAWLSASSETYDQYRGSGSLDKKQYNGKIYQPLGNHGDFISIAAHYNENRNSSYSNPTLANIRSVLGTAAVRNYRRRSSNCTPNSCRRCRTCGSPRRARSACPRSSRSRPRSGRPSRRRPAPDGNRNGRSVGSRRAWCNRDRA
ncbi:TonB-dependent receptor plug domain-containing protein [Sphingomonas sp. UYP23]